MFGTTNLARLHCEVQGHKLRSEKRTCEEQDEVLDEDYSTTVV